MAERTRARRRLRWVLSVALVALLATACSVAPTGLNRADPELSDVQSSSDEVAAEDPDAPPTGGSRSATSAETSLLSTSCADFGTPVPGEACASLLAPEDRSDPQGDRVMVPVKAYGGDVEDLDSLRAAIGDDDTPIVVLDAAFDSRGFDSEWPLQLRAGDELVITVAPRGTSASAPDVSCGTRSKAIDEFVVDCFDRLQLAGVDLDRYGAADIAADMRLLRESLGIAQWHVIAVGQFPVPIEELADELGAVDPQGIATLVLRDPDVGDGTPEAAIAGTREMLRSAVVTCTAAPLCGERFPDLGDQIEVLIAGSVEGHVIQRSPITRLYLGQDGALASADETVLTIGRGVPERDVYNLIPLIAEQTAQGRLGLLRQLEWSSVPNWTAASVSRACGDQAVAPSLQDFCEGGPRFDRNERAEPTTATTPFPVLVEAASFDPRFPRSMFNAFANRHPEYMIVEQQTSNWQTDDCRLEAEADFRLGRTLVSCPDIADLDGFLIASPATPTFEVTSVDHSWDEVMIDIARPVEWEGRGEWYYYRRELHGLDPVNVWIDSYAEIGAAEALEWAVFDYGDPDIQTPVELIVDGSTRWTIVETGFEETITYLAAARFDTVSIVVGLQADASEIEELSAQVLAPILESITVTPTTE